MRVQWLLSGVAATVLALVGGGSAQACGGGCGAGGPAAAYGAYPYWSSAYGCYLYYDPGAHCSYGCSGPYGGYSPNQDAPSPMPGMPGRAAPSAMPGMPEMASPHGEHAGPAADNGASPPCNAAAYGGQKTCPVTGAKLGSMGPAIPVKVGNQTIFVCCRSCVAKVQRDPDTYLRKVQAELAVP